MSKKTKNLNDWLMKERQANQEQSRRLDKLEEEIKKWIGMRKCGR